MKIRQVPSTVYRTVQYTLVPSTVHSKCSTLWYLVQFTLYSAVHFGTEYSLQYSAVQFGTEDSLQYSAVHFGTEYS